MTEPEEDLENLEAGSREPLPTDHPRTPGPPVLAWEDTPNRVMYTWDARSPVVDMTDPEGRVLHQFPLHRAIREALDDSMGATGALALFQIACAAYRPVWQSTVTDQALLDQSFTKYARARRARLQAADPDTLPVPVAVLSELHRAMMSAASHKGFPQPHHDNLLSVYAAAAGVLEAADL